MKTLAHILIVLIFAGLGASCSSKVSSPSSDTSTGKYSEDLASLRQQASPLDTATKKSDAAVDASVKKTVNPKLNVNTKLDAILDSISEVNLQNGYIDGFTIQVYSGIKREEALNSKKDLSTYLPELDAEVQYVQPNFRVRTGKYYDRLDAQKDYLAVKKYFPHAIVIPDRISIN